MSEDGALALLPQRVPDQPGDRVDTFLWRMDAAGLRRERLPGCTAFFEDGRFSTEFHLQKCTCGNAKCTPD
jgi:hypothetical protein